MYSQENGRNSRTTLLMGWVYEQKYFYLSRFITSYINFSPVVKSKTHRYVLIASVLKFFFVWVKVWYLWNQRPIVQVLHCYILKVQIFWAGQLFFQNLPILSVRNVKKGGIFKKWIAFSEYMNTKLAGT